VCRSPFFGGGFRLDKLFIGSMADWLALVGWVWLYYVLCFVLFFCILCFIYHPTYLPSYLRPVVIFICLIILSSPPSFYPFLLSLLPLPSLIIFLITSFIVFDRYFCSQIYFYF
jgi:hypothetical protein